MSEKDNFGTLYICATPIGNLEDITLRVLRVLREVDFIAAEDTRHTLKLLNHFGITKPLVSCHEHNKERIPQITARLKNGESAALVTDAGMPCVSDPGFEIARACITEGVNITVCPGASAAVAAIALSGLDCGRFVFEGFLPLSGNERKTALAALADEERAIILYESPKRVGATLAELADVLKNGRKAAVIKEMTKIYERAERGTLAELAEMFKAECKGEFVIVIERAAKADAFGLDLEVKEHVETYVAAGFLLKDAMKAAAKERGVSKSEIYAAYIKKEE